MKYFGTDGIRGKALEELTYDLAYKLGKSLSNLNCDTVVVAFDTRESKDILSEAVIKGAISSGLKVILANVVPTPCLIYYSYIKNIVGVMITASHNPYYDNGLKVFNKGFKLTEEEEILLEKSIDNIDEVDLTIDTKNITIANDIVGLYYSFLHQHACKTNIKIAIDCANGATYQTAPLIFSKITTNLHVIANEPDGKNINNNVGSTHLNYLTQFVLDNKCDVGFAFDGDGDRVLAIDKTGEVIDGDKLIFIIANYLKSKNKLNKNTVVFTKMSNLGMLAYLQEHQINTSIVDVGDKNVVKELLDNEYSVGGESSGHIILPNIFHTGDGTLNAMILVKIMEETNKSLKELSDCFVMYPDKTINVKVEDKKVVVNSSLLLNRVKEIKELLGSDSKVIVRASGTENLIRVSVSTKDERILDQYLNELVEIVKSIRG